MPSLFDRCCERCTHSAASPCPDYLACRLSGPFCHQDAACQRGKLEVARRNAFGPAGVAGYSGPGGLVGVGQGDCGRGVGSEAVFLELEESLGAGFEVTPTGCLGFCSVEPTVWLAAPEGPQVLYGPITPEESGRLAEYLRRGEVWEEKVVAWLPPPLAAELTFRDNRHLYSVEELAGDAYPFFLDRQMRLLTAHCGLARPTSIDDYLMRGGLHALFMLLRHYSPEDAFYLLEESGLVSRLTGEPVHSLWRQQSALGVETLRLDVNRAAANPTPQVRRLFEGQPFSVLESLLVLGRLVGARRARIVLPNKWEVPFAEVVPPGDVWIRYKPRGDSPTSNLMTARSELAEFELLGEGILGTDFDFDVEIVAGAVERGEALDVELETLLNLPAIIEHGGEWFRGFGHGEHTGTKLFLVNGPLTAQGYCEVNLGTHLDDVVELVCGGGRPEPIDWVRIDSGPRIPATALNQGLDYASAEGDAALRPPNLLHCFAAGTRVEAERPGAPEAGGGLQSLLSSFRQLPDPDVHSAPCVYAWNLVGQTLERLSCGRGELCDLNRLEDWAKFLRYNAEAAHGHWAEVLQNAIHSQGENLLEEGSGEGCGE